MGDFNIAQFIGGIVQGMGKGLTSDKGGGQIAPMEIIPRKKNAPPVIEMTPSQEAGQHIQEGAHEALQAPAMSIGAPISSPTAPVAPGDGPRNFDPVDEARIQTKILNYQPPRQATPAEQDAATKQRLLMRQRQIEESKAADKVLQDQGVVTRGGGMRQMAQGGRLRVGESAIVGDGGSDPNAQEIVTVDEDGATVTPLATNTTRTPTELLQPTGAPRTPEELSPIQLAPSGDSPASRSTGDHRTPDLPPNMELPRTVEPGMDDEAGIQKELFKQMEVKSSPWRDFGAALIQAGNNHFNNKNEPIRTWGEIQRDKRVAPLAAKLALVRDAKKARMDAETNAARVGLLNEQRKTIGEDDVRQRDNLNRQIAKDGTNEKIAMARLDQGDAKVAQGWLRLEGDAELRRLRDKWAMADDEISKKRVKLIEDEMANRNRRFDTKLEFDKQKQAQLQTYRGAALKIAGARKGSDGSPQSKTKIAQAEAALRKSVAKAVKDGVMDEDEAQDILAEGIPGYLKGGVFPIDE